MSSYTIPSVVESTARGERVTDIYSRLLSERIVFLGTPIDDGVANVVIAQMLHLAADKPSSDIHLYINSPGRLVHRDDGDLRHDAVHRARRRDDLRRPGGVGRGDPARRRSARQTRRARTRAGAAAAARHRGSAGLDERPCARGGRAHAGPPRGRGRPRTTHGPTDRPDPRRHRSGTGPGRAGGSRLRDRRHVPSPAPSGRAELQARTALRPGA